MNYEKIIVELLGRIQTLEEQVALLLEERNNKQEFTPAQAQISPKISTADIREYINKQKEIAKAEGKTSIILLSGEIHNDMNLKSQLPQVCNAMRQSMNKGDVILHTTPSGNSSTIQIKYYV